MATILSFKAAERSSSMRAGRASLYGCEIVLFPGVRYEYHVAPQEIEDSKPKRKTARKRDKLELKD